MKNTLISYCGICCSECPSYRDKFCLGCLKLEGCKIAECAKSKKKKCCFSCKEFPCKLFEDGFDWNLDEFPLMKEFKIGTVKWKPYSKEYLMLFKIGKKIKKKNNSNKSHENNKRY